MRTYRMDFERRDEAASFVAAVSRLLDSPAASTPATHWAPREVWASPGAAEGGVTLYLSAAMRELAESAFAPLPFATTCPADDRPRETMLLIDGTVRPPMGFAEAEQALGL